MSLADIDVIIPVYNTGNKILHTIKTLRQQTFSNFHVYVIDDGSTDNTPKYLMKSIGNDSRFSIIRQKNKGVSRARNNGLSHSKAKYITFIDSDDLVHNTYLETLMGLAKETNADVIISGISPTKSGQKHPIYTTLSTHSSIDKESAISKLLYDRGIGNAVYAKIYRRDIVRNNQFDHRLKIGEDMEFVFRVLASSENIILTDARLYAYIQHSDSVMNSEFTEKNYDAYYAAKKILSSKRLPSSCRNAARAKLFTESLSVCIRSDNIRSVHENLYVQCKATAKKISMGIVIDKNANKKQRAYALLCSLNFRLAISVAKLVRSMKRGAI